jgi:hypothetical protein
LEKDARRASQESAVRKRLSKAQEVLDEARRAARRPLTVERKSAEVDRVVKEMERVDRAVDENEVSKKVHSEAKELLQAMQEQIQVLRKTTKDLDVAEHLGLTRDARKLYESFVNATRAALRGEFNYRASTVEDILQAISEELVRKWKRV